MKWKRFVFGGLNKCDKEIVFCNYVTWTRVHMSGAGRVYTSGLSSFHFKDMGTRQNI